MALQNTTEVLDKINASGNGFHNKQKEALRKIANDTEKCVYLTSQHTVNTTTTLADVADLYFTVQSGRKYILEVELMTLANGTDGIKVALNTATDVTAGRVHWTYGVTAAADTAEFQTDFTSPSPTGRNAAVTKIRGFGYIQAGADGKFTLQSALHTDNNAASVIYAGSYIKIREVV